MRYLREREIALDILAQEGPLNSELLFDKVFNSTTQMSRKLITRRAFSGVIGKDNRFLKVGEERVTALSQSVARIRTNAVYALNPTARKCRSCNVWFIPRYSGAELCLKCRELERRELVAKIVELLRKNPQGLTSRQIEWKLENKRPIASMKKNKQHFIVPMRESGLFQLEKLHNRTIWRLQSSEGGDTSGDT